MVRSKEYADPEEFHGRLTIILAHRESLLTGFFLHKKVLYFTALPQELSLRGERGVIVALQLNPLHVLSC